MFFFLSVDRRLRERSFECCDGSFQKENGLQVADEDVPRRPGGDGNGPKRTGEGPQE